MLNAYPFATTRPPANGDSAFRALHSGVELISAAHSRASLSDL